ncbi:MAG: hypothetical protein LQ340_001753 [Diploschistes diacapsis]|nr:MAG: hypothetical protein LQ340_001753 [Diploschistes diacapsis]
MPGQGAAVTHFTKPFSISLGSKPKTLALPKVNEKRPYSAIAADDSEGENDGVEGRSQLVLSFDRSVGGAITLGNTKEATGPLVIEGQKNRDWRDEAQRKRRKILLPEEEQARREGRKTKNIVDDEIEEQKPLYGLVVQQRVNSDKENGDTTMQEASRDSPPKDAAGRPKTEDEEAIDALLGKEKKSTLVIENPDAPDTRFAPRLTEEDAFRFDVASRPDPASLEDYEKVPVEEFGAALMRGMGWKPGDAIGKRKGAVAKPRNVERRPALLGIGAKEVPEGLEELGAWGKGSKQTKKIDRGYNPLVLRNPKTGEVLAEGELKLRQDQNKFVAEDWRDRRDRNLATDSERKSDRRYGHRDRDQGREGSRHGASRRNTSRSQDRSDRREEYPERHRHRDRERDNDHDHRRERKSRGSKNGHDDRRHRRSDHRDDSGDQNRRHGDDNRNRRGNREDDKHRKRDKDNY